MANHIDYGPLQALIGVWKGDKGLDVAPEPNGSEDNPYHETMTFEAVGDVKNAASQCLVVIRYHQVVQRKSNGETFHDQIGYWMWDSEKGTVMHSLMIPRAVTLLAGGVPSNDGVLEVAAKAGNEDWGILQSPFMRDNARTTEFTQKVEVSGNRLSYFQTTMIDIYGKSFEHTEQNELIRQ
ncbi:MAG: heme-binding beta-barrel domain-containing protein [Mariprofundaceae bacterium]|nr:heme-binding beta-barrel domain-containing protein [Mariprofundaceae bacterium]